MKINVSNSLRIDDETHRTTAEDNDRFLSKISEENYWESGGYHTEVRMMKKALQTEFKSGKTLF